MDIVNVSRIIFSERFLLAFVVSAGLAAAEKMARVQYPSSDINGEVVCQAPTSNISTD